MGSIPGSGRSPGRGHGNPLQYSCLEKAGRLSSIGLQRVGHHWIDLAPTHPFTLALKSKLNSIPSHHLLIFHFKDYFMLKAVLISIHMFSLGNLRGQLQGWTSHWRPHVWSQPAQLQGSPHKPRVSQLWSKSHCPPYLVISTWLEHSHFHSFVYYLWLLLSCSGNRDHMAHKSKDIW